MVKTSIMTVSFLCVQYPKQSGLQKPQKMKNKTKCRWGCCRHFIIRLLFTSHSEILTGACASAFTHISELHHTDLPKLADTAVSRLRLQEELS